MSGAPTLGPGPERGLARLFRRRSLWALVRLALWLLGAAVVFGLLMLASLWFAIPFAVVVVAAIAASLAVALRVRVGFTLVRRFARRTL